MKRRTRELLKQLQSDNPKDRYIAAAELAKQKDVEAITELNKVAMFDDNADVKKMAYNAVRYLSKIKSQMDQDELRRRVMEEDEDDGGDASFWDDFDNDDDDDEEEDTKRSSGIFGSRPRQRKSKSNIEKERDSDSGMRISATDLGIPSFSFDDDDDDSEPEKQGRDDRRKRRATPSPERAKRRRRATFRLFLWLSAILAVSALLLIVEVELREPRTREDAISGLDGWLEEMINTTGVYTAALDDSSFDCGLFRSSNDFDIPVAPSWAERDGKNQEDLDDFFDSMESAEDNLAEVRRGLTALCERTSEDGVAIPPSANWKQLVDETTILHLSAATNALVNAEVTDE